jgi:IclR family transcriptional regulator, KDG regulon repressor
MVRKAKEPGERNSYSIASLRGALEVLDQFVQQESWSLGDLTQKIGQGKSRVFRSLSTFEDCGYLVREEPSGRYRLGPRLAALSTASAKCEQLRWRALPPLQALADATGETVHVGILFGDDVVTVQLVEGHHDVRMHCAVGKHSPAYCNALGKILLAYFPEPEIDAYIAAVEREAMTPYTVVEADALKRQLLEIRRCGYAIDNEERELGLRCVAAPITDHSGQVGASLSLSAPTTRLSVEEALELVPIVKESARTISYMLGSPSLARNRP